MARRTGWVGVWIPGPEIATPAGIRQAFAMYTRPIHLKWDREALRGLTSITTDRGPLKRWLQTIGRAEEDACECRVAQNAVYLLGCPLVGDGRGRAMGEARWDPEWCRATGGGGFPEALGFLHVRSYQGGGAVIIAWVLATGRKSIHLLSSMRVYLRSCMCLRTYGTFCWPWPAH